jgi:hypothetical protein
MMVVREMLDSPHRCRGGFFARSGHQLQQPAGLPGQCDTDPGSTVLLIIIIFLKQVQF